MGLSISQAAKIADVDRATWTKWEKGKSRPYDSNYVSIERALQWPPRHVSGIIAGRTDGQAAPAVPPIPEGILVDPAIWSYMTPQERKEYVLIITSAKRRQEQQRRGA